MRINDHIQDAGHDNEECDQGDGGHEFDNDCEAGRAAKWGGNKERVRNVEQGDGGHDQEDGDDVCEEGGTGNLGLNKA